MTTKCCENCAFDPPESRRLCHVCGSTPASRREIQTDRAPSPDLIDPRHLIIPDRFLIAIRTLGQLGILNAGDTRLLVENDLWSATQSFIRHSRADQMGLPLGKRMLAIWLVMSGHGSQWRDDKQWERVRAATPWNPFICIVQFETFTGSSLTFETDWGFEKLRSQL